MQHALIEIMIGKTFLFNTRIVKILSYKLDDGKCTIVTDKDWIIVPITELNKKLKDFLPVAAEDVSLVIDRRKSDVANITNILLDEIQEIRKGNFDKKKIDALNSTTHTILSIFKTEAALTKMKDK